MSVEHCVGPTVSTTDPIDSVGSAEGDLIVAWQHPDTRLISPVGLLQHGPGEQYRFRYLRAAPAVATFPGFLSFPDWDVEYRSRSLFPLFSQRIMSARRPDYQEFLRHLDLTEQASPWEQLARSEGRRTGDTEQVFPVPSVAVDGSTSCRFLVHGIRHVLPAGCLPDLTVGQQLAVVDDPSNPADSHALYVAVTAGQPLGFVPDLLLEHVHVLRRSGPVELRVEHVYGPEVPPHLRLLVHLQGVAPVGYRAMSGPRWATFV